MTSNHPSAKAQGRTLPLASHHRETWTPDEVEFVLAMTDEERDEDIAVALGRSLYAVWNLQHRLRTGTFDFAEMKRLAQRNAVAVVATCPTCHVEVPKTGVCDFC